MVDSLAGQMELWTVEMKVHVLGEMWADLLAEHLAVVMGCGSAYWMVVTTGVEMVDLMDV